MFIVLSIRNKATWLIFCEANFFFFFEFPEKNNVKLEKNVLIRKIVLFLGFRKPY